MWNLWHLSLSKGKRSRDVMHLYAFLHRLMKLQSVHITASCTFWFWFISLSDKEFNLLTAFWVVWFEGLHFEITVYVVCFSGYMFVLQKMMSQYSEVKIHYFFLFNLFLTLPHLATWSLSMQSFFYKMQLAALYVIFATHIKGSRIL